MPDSVFIEHGTTIDDAVRISQIVEATGQVDYINTSIGVATASLFMIEASMHIPPGYAMFIPSAIRKAVDAVASGNKTEATGAVKTAGSLVDSLVNKGLVHKNKAARHKSRLAAKLKKLA